MTIWDLTINNHVQAQKKKYKLLERAWPTDRFTVTCTNHVWNKISVYMDRAHAALTNRQMLIMFVCILACAGGNWINNVSLCVKHCCQFTHESTKCSCGHTTNGLPLEKQSMRCSAIRVNKYIKGKGETSGLWYKYSSMFCVFFKSADWRGNARVSRDASLSVWEFIRDKTIFSHGLCTEQPFREILCTFVDGSFLWKIWPRPF